jgi:hypothetical protein
MWLDELVEVADGLHRHGLVEELDGLLARDAKQPPERSRVVGEGVRHRRAGRGLDPLREVGDLCPEPGEISHDRHRVLGGDVET